VSQRHASDGAFDAHLFAHQLVENNFADPEARFSIYSPKLSLSLSLAGCFNILLFSCLSAFSASTLLVGRQEGHPATEWWDAGVVICLERGADLHMAQLMPLPLTASFPGQPG